MHLRNGSLRLSATDLSRYLACPHLTQLDRAVAEGRRGGSGWHDPRHELLQERGLQHEAAYVAFLRDQGRSIVELDPEDGTETAAIEAMRGGPDVITQAVLREDPWSGRADLLFRVEEPSALGSWSYEVADTKLAHETRGGTVLQLCVYSALITRLLERAPARMHVVRPGPDFPTDTYRLADYEAYFRSVQRRLRCHLGSELPDTYPKPVPHCEVCEWWPICDKQRHDDDHLSLVAGIHSHQIDHLHEESIQTLADFAKRSWESIGRPRRGSREALQRSWEQARVQQRGRVAEAPVHELLPLEPGRGLARLPEPSPGDLFFDFEGDPFVDPGGLEYLFGFVTLREPPPSGEPSNNDADPFATLDPTNSDIGVVATRSTPERYSAIWALNRTGSTSRPAAPAAYASWWLRRRFSSRSARLPGRCGLPTDSAGSGSWPVTSR